MQLASGLLHPAKVRSSDLPDAALKPASVSTFPSSSLISAKSSSATGTTPPAVCAVAATERIAFPGAAAGAGEPADVEEVTAPPPLPSPRTPTAQVADRGT